MDSPTSRVRAAHHARLRVERVHGLIVLAYALGGVCMYFTARSYAMMTEVLPSAVGCTGSPVIAGQIPRLMAGWMILLDYLLIPAFVYVLVAVALQTLIPGIDRGVWIVLLALITTSVNWFGISVTARANFVAVALQFCPGGVRHPGTDALYSARETVR